MAAGKIIVLRVTQECRIHILRSAPKKILASFILVQFVNSFSILIDGTFFCFLGSGLPLLLVLHKQPLFIYVLVRRTSAKAKWGIPIVIERFIDNPSTRLLARAS